MKTDTSKKILEFITKNGPIAPKYIISYIGFGPAAVFRQLKKLQQQNLIKKIGAAPRAYYQLHLDLTNEKEKSDQFFAQRTEPTRKKITVVTKVGVGVLVLKNNQVLLKKRRGKHGNDEYEDAGGGHLEYMESFANCAKRELREELGIEIKNLRFLCLSNIKKYAPNHYIDIGLVAEWASGEPVIKEPEKCSAIGWFELDNLPEPLTEWTKNYLEAYNTKRNYFDY